MKVLNPLFFLVAVLMFVGADVFFPALLPAHCDTLDGPVVKEAKSALESGDITPVLKWVKPDDETEIREVFDQVLKVRTESDLSRLLADRYFFETLVRIHREGEGAPYTGLKPAGSVDPGIAKADQSLETGSVDQLVEALTEQISDNIRQRFAAAHSAKQHAEDSVIDGRRYVESYVSFIHYIEELHKMTTHEVGLHEH